MQSSTGFDDLPTELLEKIIFDPVLNGDLIHLAQISRRICSIAIPAYLARHNILNPTSFFSVTVQCVDTKIPRYRSIPVALPRRDVLSGLALGFHIKSIHKLEYVFRSGWDCYFNAELRDCRRSLSIIQRLDRVSIVTLRFDISNDYGIGKTIPLRREFMEDLLNTLIEKGCETLSLNIAEMVRIQKIWIEKGFGKKLLYKAKALVHSTPISPTLEGPTWEVNPWCYPPSVGLIYLSPKARQSSRLRHLIISNLTPLHPPFAHWTYSILSTPLLTALTLSGIKISGAGYFWDTIFRWLVIPLQAINHGHLLELSIENCGNLVTLWLIEFILQLDSLRHLKLAYPMPYAFNRDGDRFRPKLSIWVDTEVLPNLVSLHAFSDWVDFLLPTSTPRDHLKNLYIIPRERDTAQDRGTFNYQHSLKTLGPILTKPTLPSPQELDISLDLCQMKYGERALDRDVQEFGHLGPRIEGYEAYDRITTLVMGVYNPRSKTLVETSEQMCRFFNLWKGLKVVKFVPWGRVIAYKWERAIMVKVDELGLGLERIEFGDIVYDRKEGGLS